MLTRIVKMTFMKELIPSFKSIYTQVEPKIEEYEGCIGVQLVQDINDPRVFFTLSRWENEGSLEHYRNSQLFQETWSEVKKKFASRPEAWSTKSID